MVAPGTQPGARPQPSRLPREQRREHLLDVAAELVADAGIEAFTMESLAGRAGVSKGLGYAYFDNAGDLLLALFDREVAALDREVAVAIAAAGGFEERLRATLLTWFDLVADRGPLIAALFVPEADGVLARRRQARNRDVERYWAAMATEEYGLDPERARAAASVLLAGTNGVLAQWRQHRADRNELIDLFVTMATGALSALRAGADPPQVRPH